MIFKLDQVFIFSLLCSVLSFSCTKSPINNNTNTNTNSICNILDTLKCSPVPPLTKGESIYLNVGNMQGASYLWEKKANYQNYNRNPIISDADFFKDEGWYYLTVTHPDCKKVVYDSVFVDVRLKQGSPSCTPKNNFGDFTNGFPDQNYSNFKFTKGFNSMEGNTFADNGVFMIYLSEYYETHPIEDGIYYTKSSHPDEYEIDKVYFYVVSQNIGMQADTDAPVYVSHVNGKVCITFCNIEFTGTNGPTGFTTKVSLKITEK